MTEALIIGGGICGSVAAMALQRIGVKATLYEAYPTRADNLGGFFGIPPNGMDALRVIDVMEQVVANSFPVSRSEVMELSGKVVAKVDFGDLLPGMAGFHTLRRDHLVRVLQDEAIRRGTRVEWGKRLAAAEVTPDGAVVARFADGTEAAGDLLIGADGIHSPTRRIIAPRAPKPRYNGYLTISGHARVPSSAAMPVSVARMIVGRHVVFGHATAQHGDTWWYAIIPSRELTRAELAATAAEEWKSRLSGIFAGGSTAAAVIEAAADDIVAYGDYYLPSLPTWHNRSMVIIGDAAHAVPEHSGQGASMAIEDGVELARCLRDIPDLPAAFATFERLRRPRADRVRVDVLAEMATPNVVQRLFRSAWTRIRPRRRSAAPDQPVALAQARHHIDWDASVLGDPALERGTGAAR